MMEDKALLTLVGLVALAWFFSVRVAALGWRRGLPKVEGLVFFPALFAWLGAPLGSALSVVTTLAVLASLLLLMYGWRELSDWRSGAEAP
jgi:hypothetical protein